MQQHWNRDGRGRPTSQHILAGGSTQRRRRAGAVSTRGGRQSVPHPGAYGPPV
uniref:hypothetical protein n=1 Tax=Hymenobacter cellulosivorans TaxID=2932249 RepID=UPI0035C9CD5C